MQPTGLQGSVKPQSGYLNGIIPFANNAAIEAAEGPSADELNNKPVIQGLAGHVRKVWDRNWRAKQKIEERMLQSMRQRRGEYDPDVLAEIKQAGGSEIYMMLSANKARAASSWIKDTLLGSGTDKCWTITPTSLPDISPQIVQQVTQQTYQEASELAQVIGQGQVTPEMVKQIALRVRDRVTAKIREDAKRAAANMEDKMEDQLQEGGFIQALSDFIDDMCTFPSAIMRGPVVRKRNSLNWVKKPDGDYEAVVEEKLVKEWERVDPFMIYPSPDATGIDEGDFIHRHRLSRSDLVSMKGVEGYNDAAIDAVLDQYGRDGLHEWLRVDSEKAHVEGKNPYYTNQNPQGLIDALQYFGSVQGKMLVEWGMDKAQVPDENKEYPCEVWLIGDRVIKAVLNYDPLGRTNYYKASYEEVPGVFWGNSPLDLIRDCQTVCNAAARALVNNMGIASGPQVDINVSRLPAGEDITEMYPWKIWQTKSDPYGSSAPAINFYQPNLLANELMGVYERFATLADEYSSIPKYIAGDATPGGAGRTASGLSMLMSNAGKGIKQVISNIDNNVIAKAIRRLYEHNMKYETDPTLKGDVNIVAKGASGLVIKESIQQRRNEFMQIALNSPVAGQVIGQNGIAALLREGAKNLDMDVEELVPSKEEMQVQQMQQTAMPPQAPNTMSNPNQQLQDGSPVTDNFSPMRQA